MKLNSFLTKQRLCYIIYIGKQYNMLHNQQQYIDFVRLYLVDFINSKTDEERLSNFDKAINEGLIFLSSGISGRSFKEGMLPSNCEVEEIRHIQSIVLKMLRIALIDDEFKKLYPEVDNDSIDETGLEKYIHDLFIRYKFPESYRWRGRGKNYVSNLSVTSSYIIKSSEHMIVSILFNLFESNETAEASGYQYFSFCPKCGKFFYKKRKDQVYCSERCRAAESSLRHLRSKKQI